MVVRRLHEPSLWRQRPASAAARAGLPAAAQVFAISGRGMPPRFIHAVLLIKKVAAEVNADLGLLPRDIASAIGASADDLFSDPNCTAHFPVDIFQTGSGTSTNMNANEVLATLAGRRLGSEISPNDHVNCSQSSNDVIPTAIHVSAAIALKEQLQPALSHLTATIRAKADETDRFVKNGRTHLMDAMPLRMSQALNGWAAQIEAGSTRLEQLTSMLGNLAQGGTAVGTGINAHPDFAKHFAERLSEITALSFRPAPRLSLSSRATASFPSPLSHSRPRASIFCFSYLPVLLPGREGRRYWVGSGSNPQKINTIILCAPRGVEEFAAPLKRLTSRAQTPAPPQTRPGRVP